jgi:hypothetical protein
MEKLSTEKYQYLINACIATFWRTRNSQSFKQKIIDQGTRGAVTGGKQLDGFIELLALIAKDLGIPESCIHTRRNFLPGFFRPSKNWDLVIISPNQNLIAAVEFKSQVGSFGNNFNNRVEEALGSAVNLWTAYKEGGFSQTQQPWLGYGLVVEENIRSTTRVSLQEPHFRVRQEFLNTSYLDRYVLFCQKLMQERHYNSTTLIGTADETAFGYPSKELSLDTFIMSYMGFLQGRLNEFE